MFHYLLWIYLKKLWRMQHGHEQRRRAVRDQLAARCHEPRYGERKGNSYRYRIFQAHRLMHVVVVGGGISGLTAAWHLARSHKHGMLCTKCLHVSSSVQRWCCTRLQVDLAATFTFARLHQRRLVTALADERALRCAPGAWPAQSTGAWWSGHR